MRAEVPQLTAVDFFKRPENIVDHLRILRLSSRCHWKRVLDILLSLFALILLLPLMLVTIPLIKLTSRGPVLFQQERIGLNRRSADRRKGQQLFRGLDQRHRYRNRRKTSGYGRPFRMYKFRTMVVDAEKNGEPMLARKGDPRITPLGRVMRKTRIDELPQFINVLRGEMSIVGPRPERAFYIDEMKKDIPNFPLRLQAKPGITGLAQVELGYANDTEGMRNKLRFDLQYIQSSSVFTDLRILLKTISVVLTGKGAC